MKSIGLSSLLALILSGCAGSPNSANVEMSPEGIERLTNVALTDVQDIYLKETNLADLVAAGLQRVAEDYPPANVDASAQSIRISHGDTELHLIAWDESADAEFWSVQTALSLERLHGAFPAETAPSFTALSDSFMIGLTDGLDGRNRYYSPQEVSSRIKRQRDATGTLGINLISKGSNWQVGRIYSTDLLESQLLQSGDVLLEIDGTPVSRLEVWEVFDLLAGEAGSPVVLKVDRPGVESPTLVTVSRREYGGDTVSAVPDGDILDILVTVFDRRTADDLRSSLRRVTDQSETSYAGIILDLRGNTGGLLYTSVEVANTFMKEGSILTTRGRHPDSFQFFSANRKDHAEGLPIVVLADGQTGSGAEFVIAALQDQGRAIVVGGNSFGSGSIQTALRLPNRGELQLTWAEMYTNGGYSLENRGVLPTVCTGGEQSFDSILAELRSGGGIIDRATRTREIDPDDEAALKAHRALCPPRNDAQDFSLEVAKTILQEPGLYDQIMALDGGQHSAAATH